MNGRCETCEAEKVCAYEYKPTECCDHRKFRRHPDAIECTDCEGSGQNTYPMTCRACGGCGMVLRSNDQHNRPASAGPG